METDRKLIHCSDEELLQYIHAPEKGVTDDAMNLLLERYKGEVRRQARTYYLIGADQEDLLQEGMIGLYKAIRAYQMEVGTFQGFARLCISRQLTSALRASLREKQQPLNQAISLDRSVNDEEGEERTMMELLPDPAGKSPEEQAVEVEEEAALLQRIKESLSSMENMVLDRYLAGMDYHAIARELNMGDKAADNAIQRIRRKIRKLF